MSPQAGRLSTAEFERRLQTGESGLYVTTGSDDDRRVAFRADIASIDGDVVSLELASGECLDIDAEHIRDAERVKDVVNWSTLGLRRLSGLFDFLSVPWTRK